MANKLYDTEKIIMKIIIIIKNYEIKREILNSVNLWISSYKKGKNDKEWTITRKAFFWDIEYTSAWVSRSSHWKVLWKISVLGILEPNK